MDLRPLAGIVAMGRDVPAYVYEQEELAERFRRWLCEEGGSARLARVFTSAGVGRRASVVPLEHLFSGTDFETCNARHEQECRAAGLRLAQDVLGRAGLAPADVGIVVSVSCTGFMIPALDAQVADRLGLGPRLVRLPITESGCAGGVVGLSRAAEHLAVHPDRAALLLAVETPSLTFQRWDRSPANVVSTALFGDGGAAVVLVGREHPAFARAQAHLTASESLFFPGTTHLMGFRLRNTGLQMVLDASLPRFVRRHVGAGVDGFLERCGLTRAQVARWCLHPGGRRVVEALRDELSLSDADLAPTDAVLTQHGNMSSVTVLYVLDELLTAHRAGPGEAALVGAFGPGFCAELALLRFA